MLIFFEYCNAETYGKRRNEHKAAGASRFPVARKKPERRRAKCFSNLFPWELIDEGLCLVVAKFAES